MFNTKRFAGIALAGIIAITGAATAFAASQADSGKQSSKNGHPARINFSQMSTAIKSALDGLVAAGTITQAQEDAVLKIMPADGGKGGPGGPGPEGLRKDPMSGLVAAGTVTQAQADAIHEAVKTARDSGKTIKDVLDGLVAAGTVTQAQEDAVLKIMPADGGKGGPGGPGPEGLRKDPMSGLVAAGTITQAQADAIQSAVKSAMEAAAKTSK